jgi:glutathione S-transferase
MSLKLYYHPLSSYCHKALIALYENGTAFEPVLVDLQNEKERAAFYAIWQGGKFPVLRDGEQIIPESTIIIEYLAQHYPGPSPLLPGDPDRARQTRFYDRFFDLFVHNHMQKIIGDRLRPADRRDPQGVEEAKANLRKAYEMIDAHMAGKRWALGEDFSMADCAAAPALFYASQVEPFGEGQANVAAYSERLQQRPSYARALKEAEPYFKNIPK